jgi:outer membrane protein assembly factor BamB
MNTFLRLHLALFALVLAASLFAEDWPQFLGPHRDGTSTETGLVASWDKKGPPLLWQHDIGPGFAGPVVAGDHAIVFYRQGNEEVVESLDAATGKRQWKFAYATAFEDDFRKGDGPRSTPLVADKHVYTLGADGKLHCLDLAKGEKVWAKSLLDEYDVPKSYFGIGTSPIIEGNLLCVNVGGKEGAGVVAFAADTGKEVWRASSHKASYASPVAATIDGTRHLLFFTREGLLSLDPKDGKERFSKRWRARIEASVNAATPLVIDGHVFASASYNTGAGLFKVNKDGLEVVWANDKTLSAHYNTPVRQGDYLYGIEGRQEQSPELRCVEWKTGKVRWSKENFGCASMVLADGKLIALTEEGDLVLAEATPEAYREKGRAALLTGPCRAEIALANARLSARDARKVYCWNLKK